MPSPFTPSSDSRASACRASARLVCTLAALVALVAGGPAALAGSLQHHKHPQRSAKKITLEKVDLPDMGLTSYWVPDEGQKYELRLARRGDDVLDIVYRVGDNYVPQALAKLSDYLHDNHNFEVKDYNPRTFDVLHTMLARLKRSDSVIEVLSAYRTKETNDALRASRRTNAAEHSHHIEGDALDFRVPGVPAARLRDAALSLRAGGVGYYPRGQFVHVDTGPVRKWTYVPHRGKRSRRHRRS